MSTLRIVYTAEDRVSPTLRKIDAANAQLQASVDRSGAALQAAGARWTAFGSKLSSIGTAMSAAGRKLTTYVTLPIVGIGVLAGKASIDFETAMKRIQTQAGASAQDVAKLKGQVIDLAKHAQQGPTELADALYHLKSVGMGNVSAMNALRASSKLAAVSGASLEDVTNALAGAWRSGIQGSKNFGKAVGVLNAIVGAGNMRMSDLIGAIGTGILPAARTFGLSINDVGAALALMTDSGMQANSAATRLRMGIALLGAPSAKATTELKTIGLSSLDLAQAMRKPEGLLVALTMLHDHLQQIKDPAKQAQLITSAFGGGRSSAGIMTLLNNLDVLKRKYEQIDKTSGNFNKDVAAQGKTAAAKWAKAWAGLQAVGVQLGNKLVPIFTDHIVPAIEKVVSFFDHLTSSQQDFIVKAGLMAAALGPVLRIMGGIFRFGGSIARGIGGVLGKLAGKGTTMTSSGSLSAAATGLSDAAVALNGAATALDEAAAKLSVGGAGGAAGAVEGGAAAAGATGAEVGGGAAIGASAAAGGIEGSAAFSVAPLIGGVGLAGLAVGGIISAIKYHHQLAKEVATETQELVHGKSATANLAAAQANLRNVDTQTSKTTHVLAGETKSLTKGGYVALAGAVQEVNDQQGVLNKAQSKADSLLAKQGTSMETFETKTVGASTSLGHMNTEGRILHTVMYQATKAFAAVDQVIGQTGANMARTNGITEGATSKFRVLKGAVDDVPAAKTIKIQVNDNDALQTVRDYNALLANIPRTITTVMNVDTSLHGGGRLPGHAAGGPVFADQPVMVGENGPEMFVPAQNGDIVPHHKLGGGLQLVEGRLTIDESGRAYIRGVVQEVNGEDARYARSVGRQRR